VIGDSDVRAGDVTPENQALYRDAHQVLPAVAEFGDPLLAPSPPGKTAVDMRALLEAIEALDGFAVASDRIRAASHLHAVAAAESRFLAAQLDNSDAAVPPRSVAQQYFRIRTAVLSGDQALWHCLRVVADAAGDLIDAPVSGSDLHRLGLAISTVLSRMSGSEHGRATSHAASSMAATWAVEEIWLRRWIIGHQVHAMLNVFAAYAIADATDAVRAKDLHRAVAAINDATRIVEGFSAARAHALAVPAAFYQDVLRPTMLPPLTAAPLSGRMHGEYRGYRRRLDELLKVLPVCGTPQAASQPALALAGERLLEADIIEAERHVTSVEPLVGDTKSLIQSTKSTENAVSALRAIRHRRAARAAPYLRFPDQAVIGGSADHSADLVSDFIAPENR
jgi:hypothetical protein